MTVVIQDSKANAWLLHRIESLARYLGISKAQAAALIIRESPLTSFEQLMQRETGPLTRLNAAMQNDEASQ